MSNKNLKVPPLKPLCSYPGRLCTRDRLRGYCYCINHILKDKEALFQRCTFALNGKQCRNAAPKSRKSLRYCPYHVHRFNVLQSMSTSGKLSLENSDVSPTQPDENVLVNGENSSKLSPTSAYRQISKKYGFDDRDLKMKDMWLETSDESESDLESEVDDPLKHAGVYTYEEIASIYKTKLMRLQSLYIDQCSYLSHCLKEKRRKYLQAKEAEKSYNLTSNYKNLNPEEKKQYEVLKAMYRYRRHYGKEAVLRKRYIQKRFPSEHNENIPLVPVIHCCYHENNERCNKDAVVLSKYCYDHILHDPHQVLFKKCDGSANCPKPVIPTGNNTTCILHSHCQPLPEKKKSTNTIKNIASSALISNERNAEPLQPIDDLASLELNAVSPQSLFNLNQYGDVDESFGDSIINLVSGFFDSKDT